MINFSISGGGNPYTDAVELAFLDAFNAGISVNASAGNSGPGAGTSDHGGPWVTTVGASTGPRFFVSTLHLTADGGATFDMPGVTITNGISTPTPVVLGRDLPGEDAGCQTTLAAGTLPARSSSATRHERPHRQGPQGPRRRRGRDDPLQPDRPGRRDRQPLPAGDPVDGRRRALLAFVNTHTNVKATWAQGVATPASPT